MLYGLLCGVLLGVLCFMFFFGVLLGLFGVGFVWVCVGWVGWFCLFVCCLRVFFGDVFSYYGFIRSMLGICCVRVVFIYVRRMACSAFNGRLFFICGVLVCFLIFVC